MEKTKSDSGLLQESDIGFIKSTLLQIQKQLNKLDTQSNLQKDYLSTYEACSYLACTRGMLWKLVTAGKLTKLKLDNGRTYYSSQELKKLIESPPGEIKA